jgi:ribonucleoside-diphosphate reductase alpha chain
MSTESRPDALRGAVTVTSAERLRFARLRTREGENPFDTVEWELRTARISAPDGTTVFEQENVEVPKSWSASAVNVVVSKYFRGRLGSPERETSVRQMIDRVAGTISGWGEADGYFEDESAAATFRAELTHLLLHQGASFNSPVWFNVGMVERPQCSACFINSVEDTMPAILKLAHTEGMLFKFGSGTGSNLSSLRSSKEELSGGGHASGPVSFMRGFDAFAGVIKSGGATRRAAKMVILDVAHPDIREFAACKAEEEKKAQALIAAGYDPSFNVDGGAYDSVFHQNANHSIRASDDFMRAVEADDEWTTRTVCGNEPAGTFSARTLLHEVAEATWVCGDPGVQFDTLINDWHTCPNSGRINASNPCSEYMFLDDSACNLASLNLLSFYDAEEERFDVEGFKHACEILITAQEVVVDRSSYPTEAITNNSRDYRPLGLGFANLGALLMARGLPYDSEAGRDFAAAITALMTGAGYRQSARIAASRGAFEGFAPNRQPMLRVMRKHRDALKDVDPAHVPLPLMRAGREIWDDVVEAGEEHGFRNSQVSVIAPTGTIAFMMDCDTTGIEPDIALVKYKRLHGGGMIKLVNGTVATALRRLGYESSQVQEIVEYIDDNDTIEEAPGLATEHLAVFDCAFRPANGTRSIHHLGHLRMVAAVQPFVSGAVSKTINMPESSSVDDIYDAYLESWRLGLKAVAIYRDGCKKSQPLSTSEKESTATATAAAAGTLARRKLPDERRAVTHKFSVGGHEGYITVGVYEDGFPGEIFLVMAKEGSTISGLMDTIATSVSIALQYGVPLRTLVDKFSHARFEPSGFTNNSEIPIAKSIVDYVFRWLASKFLSNEELDMVGIVRNDAPVGTVQPQPDKGVTSGVTFLQQQDAPTCADCGSIMVRNGTCYKCLNCGSTSGCS